MNFYIGVMPEDEALVPAVHSRLHLAYGMGPGLCLTAGALDPKPTGGLLGLCDDQPPGEGDEAAFAAAVLAECGRRAYTGVLADFERSPTSRARTVLAALSQTLSAAGLPLYVPLGYGRALPEARVLVPSGVSYGPLADHLAAAAAAWPGRAVLELQGLALSHPLPCPRETGQFLTWAQLEDLCASAQTWYSPGLGCRCLVTQPGREGRFVRFDTAETLAVTLALAATLGFAEAIALWPEVQARKGLSLRAVALEQHRTGGEGGLTLGRGVHAGADGHDAHIG